MLSPEQQKLYDNSFKIQKPSPKSYGLYFSGSETLMRQSEGQIEFPTFAVLPKGVCTPADYLFSIGDDEYFLLRQKSCPKIPGFAMVSGGVFKDARPLLKAFGGLTVWQYYRFREESKYCSSCGTPLSRSTTEHAYICPCCARVIYPKFSPAILALVKDGERALLVRSRHYSNTYSPVAGFVEVGESFEQTVAREVLEETGVKAKNIRYFGSQPWSFGDTIMIAYTAELDGSDSVSVQPDEILEAHWFERSSIPKSSSNRSLGGKLMESFRKGEI